MTLDLLNERGTPVARQCLSWRELTPPPISKLDDEAWTRIRIQTLLASEAMAVRFSHGAGQTQRDLRGHLAEIRRIEQLQQSTLANLMPPDFSALETAIALEQSAVELAAAVALAEPDRYLAQSFRYALLDDLDHLYRFIALGDRLQGLDGNTILQCNTDIRPGRSTRDQHGAAPDDLRHPYDRHAAAPLSKVHVTLMFGLALAKRDAYLHAGPTQADPAARLLFAEIAAVEEQHATQFGALSDPAETWLEKWLLLETAEAYGYWSGLGTESNARLRPIWERFLDYELGHLSQVKELMRRQENRDPEPLLPVGFSHPLALGGHREQIRAMLDRELGLSVIGGDFIAPPELPEPAPAGPEPPLAASEWVAQHYQWQPGGELFGDLPSRKEHLLMEYF